MFYTDFSTNSTIISVIPDNLLGDRVKGGSKKKPDNIKFPGYGKKPSQGEVKKEECEEERTEEPVGEESDSTTTTKAPDNGNDSVSVNTPDEDASIAEAKPVSYRTERISNPKKNINLNCEYF